MKKVLFATDFSDACDYALRYALALIEKQDITIDLLNVYDIPVLVSSSMPSIAIDSIIKEKTNAVESHLLEFQQQIPAKHRGTFKAIYGPFPATEIAEFAKEGGYDFIVMGMKQKYGLFDRMIGTITAQTIQLSTIPVLAVPSQSSYTPLQKILFPTANPSGTDLPREEVQAIEWLTAFANLFGNPNIHMVHIEKAGGKEALDITFKEKINDKLDFTVSHAETIEDGIISFYEKEHAEMLCFYKPNRFFWERLHHSSLIRKILFRARVPMLIFR